MLKIERVSDNSGTKLSLSGELRSDDLHELRTEIIKISPRLVLDLTEVSAVDRDGVKWLNACRVLGVEIENCAPYIREWMRQENA